MNIRRTLSVIFITLGSLLLLLLVVVLSIVYFYEEEVKQILVGQINKQLATPVSVKNIELSLFQKFPNATLVFTDVSAESVQPADSLNDPERFKERLFVAKKIFLQFNVLDIFHKKYHIHKIEIEGASMQLLVNQSGHDNFHFWKASTDTGSNTSQVNLEKITIHSSDFIYKNIAEKTVYSFIINSSELSGKFSEKNYTVVTQGEYFVDSISVGEINYLKRKSVELEGTLNVTDNQKYEIQKAQLSLNELSFDVNGFFATHQNKNSEIGLSIKGKNLDIKTLISLLPATYRQKLNTYSSSGLFYFDMNLSGSVGKGIDPKIKASFGIKNGEIIEENSALHLSNLNLTGSYSNGEQKNAKTSVLNIGDFKARLGSGKLLGNFSLRNFNSPFLTLVAEAKLNLSEVKQFLKIDTLEKCSGQLTLDLDYAGSTSQLEHLSGSEFIKTRTQGNLIIEQGYFLFKGAKQSFDNINASLLFNNNDVVVNECNGKIEDSDFALRGFFRNALAASFNKDEKLFIDASLTSQWINLNQILADDETSTSTKKAFELQFSDRINFNLNVDVRKLSFKRFEAQGIKGNVKLQDKKMALAPISFSTMDGTVLANSIIDGSEQRGFKTICEADLKNITISKLFYSFENFGGTTLTDKNLRGKASAIVQFSGDFSSELKSKTESIVSRFDLNIDNGELLNFEPMRKLSRFISLTELNDIRFATLKNTIEIKDRKISIPKMEINSSALNLTVAGTHTFDNYVDYHFKLLLSELLGKKARKAKPENDEFGLVEDDGLSSGKTTLYISMVGALDNPKISYDKGGLKMEMKKNVANETANLKSILKSEFGWFKKDSTIKSPVPKKQISRFETTWEESASETNDKSKKESTLPKVKAENSAVQEKKKIKVLDDLLKKDAAKKKKSKADKEENSDDFN